LVALISKSAAGGENTGSGRACSLPELNSGAIIRGDSARVVSRKWDGRRPAMRRPYFSAGATIFITNEVGASPGPNGPGTLLLTGGRLLR
jgi:hypothetical protein